MNTTVVGEVIHANLCGLTDRTLFQTKNLNKTLWVESVSMDTINRTGIRFQTKVKHRM